MNLGARSSSLSFGTRGIRYTINTRGRSTTTARLPGTGLSYSTSSGRRTRSYKSSTYSKQLDIDKKLKEKKQLEEQNRLHVEKYENHINLIRQVHSECDDVINWQDILAQPEPFAEDSAGPKEQEATKAADNFKPNIIEKIFLNNGQKRLQKLKDNIERSRQEDTESYLTWKDSISLANKVLSGDIESYYAVIEEANPFEDLVEFGSGFEFGTEDPRVMEVEFVVKSSSVVPQTAKTLTKTGKLSEKALSKTAYFDITQDYVCSCSIRLAREIFAILPVRAVIVHAVDSITNTTTGHDEMTTILSVGFLRDKFTNVNFDRIDASDFVETFVHQMNFKKTTGFHPVNRIQL